MGADFVNDRGLIIQDNRHPCGAVNVFLCGFQPLVTLFYGSRLKVSARTAIHWKNNSCVFELAK